MEKFVLKKMINIFVLICLFLVPLTVNADSKTLRNSASDVKYSIYQPLKLTIVSDEPETRNYETNATIIQDYNHYTEADLVPSGQGEASKRYVYYKDAIDYFGTPLSVRIDLTVLSGTARVGFVLKDNTYGYDHQLIYANVNGGQAEITMSFYDEDGNDFNFTGLYGLIDPDLGNYKFDTTGRQLYYKDAGLETGSDSADYSKLMADNMNVVTNNPGNEGLFPVDVSTNYHEGILFIQLDSENSFTINTESWSDWIILPYLYSLEYRITYDLKGTEEFPATNDPTNPTQYAPGNTKDIKNPERPGYRFVKWTREDITDPASDKNSNVLPDDRGDKKFIAEWEKVEYKLKYDPNDKYVDKKEFEHKVDKEMADQTVTVGDNTTNVHLYESKGFDFNGWNTEPDGSGTPYEDPDNYAVDATMVDGVEDGGYVGTLYAQWTPKKYNIIYNKNADDATGTMETQTFNLVDNPDTWDSSNPWTFERTGYSLVGYKIENDGEMLPTDAKDYQVYLLDDDNQKVELFAQWKPWEYYIKYDGNGANNPDAMPTDTFSYFATSMSSKDNLFKREGYRFTGFKVTIDGNVRIVRSPEEFKDILKAMKPYSSITLVAQWDKIPKGYAAPVTGIN